MINIKLRKSYSGTTVILFMILIYLISTLLQGIIPFSINRIATFCILLVILMENLVNPNKKGVMLIFYICVTAVYTMLMAQEPDVNLKDYIYFISALLTIQFFTNEKNRKELQKSVQRELNLMKSVIYLAVVLTVISLFIKANYAISWSERYYVGFTRDPHAVASSLCLLMAFTLLVFKPEKFAISRMMILVFLMAVVFMSGARTFMIPAILICYVYIKDNLKNQKIKIFVYILATLLIAYIFINSNMMEKFIWSSNAANQYATNNLVSMSGGRSEFWIIDLREFIKQNIFVKFFGRGFDFPYITNKKYYNMHIWSHNDIIDLLLSVGIVGMVIYGKIWKDFLMKSRRQIKSKMVYGLLLIYVLFPLIFNGMFTYQHYLLSSIIFAMSLELSN